MERPLSRLIIEGRFASGDVIDARLAEDGTVAFDLAEQTAQASADGGAPA